MATAPSLRASSASLESTLVFQEPRKLEAPANSAGSMTKNCWLSEGTRRRRSWRSVSVSRNHNLLNDENAQWPHCNHTKQELRDRQQPSKGKRWTGLNHGHPRV